MKKKLIIICLIIITIISIGLISYKVLNKNKDNTNLQTLKKISNKEKKIINENTLNIIFEWNKESDKVKLINNKNLGFYLVLNKDYSNLLDVYELTYKYNNKEYKVYSTVLYSQVKYEHHKLLRNNGAIYGNVVKVGDKTMWGYEKIEDLYSSLKQDKKINIISSKGLYTQNKSK